MMIAVALTASRYVSKKTVTKTFSSRFSMQFYAQKQALSRKEESLLFYEPSAFVFVAPFCLDAEAHEIEGEFVPLLGRGGEMPEDGAGASGIGCIASGARAG